MGVYNRDLIVRFYGGKSTHWNTVSLFGQNFTTSHIIGRNIDFFICYYHIFTRRFLDRISYMENRILFYFLQNMNCSSKKSVSPNESASRIERGGEGKVDPEEQIELSVMLRLVNILFSC